MAFETLRAELELDTSGFRAGVRDARSDLGGLQDRAQSVGRGMQRAGGIMTAGITAPLAAMAGASASAAADFDQSMQQSIAVMGDVDDAMREDLEETAREVATNMAVSHDEAAESFYFLASAGLDAAEAMEAMPDVAALAEAGQMEMAEATDIATNVMSAYGKEAEDLDEITDRMTATVTNHNQTMEGAADALSRVAPTAAGVGIELEELNAAIGGLGDVGIQGQRAGTALNTVISQMSDETSPAAQSMEEMGVSVRNAEGEMLPLVEIISRFEEAGADAGDMAEIFGTRGGPAMAALLEQGSGALEENTENIRELDGVTEEVAETQRDTLNAQLDILRSNVRDAGIVIGENLLPVLNSLVERLMPVAEWFQDLSERQQQTIIVVGALIAAMGPLLIAVGTLLTMLPAMAAGLGMVSAAAAPVTLPILATVAAVGALVAIFATDFLGIRSIVEDVFGAILEYIQPAIDVLREDFIETLEVVRGRVDTVLSFLSDIWDEHGEHLLEIVDWYLTPLQTTFEMVMEAIKTAVDSTLDALVTAFRVGMALVRGDWEEAWELIMGFADRQLERFEELGENLMETLAKGIRKAANAPTDAIEGVMDGVRDYMPFSDAREGPLSDLTASGEAIPGTVADGAESNMGRLAETMETVPAPSGGGRGPGSSGASESNLAQALEGMALELSGTLDVEGDVATMDDVDARIRRAGRQAQNRGIR